MIEARDAFKVRVLRNHSLNFLTGSAGTLSACYVSLFKLTNGQGVKTWRPSCRHHSRSIPPWTTRSGCHFYADTGCPQAHAYANLNSAGGKRPTRIGPQIVRTGSTGNWPTRKGLRSWT